MNHVRHHESDGTGSECAAGFTLVELLVVIAIISVLAGLLIPALVMAQRSSKTTACLGNMRQILVLHQYYTNVYGGFLPFNYGKVGPYPWDRQELKIPGRFTIGFKDGPTSDPPYDPMMGEGPLSHIPFGSWFVLLSEFAEGNYDLFWCIAKPANAWENRPSYGQNLEIATLSGDGIYYGPGMFEITRDGMSEVRIRYPSKLLIYADSAFDDTEGTFISEYRKVKFSMRLAHRKGAEGLNLYGPGVWHPAAGGDEGSFVGGHHAGNAASYDRVLYWNDGPLASEIWVNQ